MLGSVNAQTVEHVAYAVLKLIPLEQVRLQVAATIPEHSFVLDNARPQIVLHHLITLHNEVVTKVANKHGNVVLLVEAKAQVLNIEEDISGYHPVAKHFLVQFQHVLHSGQVNVFVEIRCLLQSTEVSVQRPVPLHLPFALILR